MRYLLLKVGHCLASGLREGATDHMIERKDLGVPKINSLKLTRKAPVQQVRAKVFHIDVIC